jgi:copper chaperone
MKIQLKVPSIACEGCAEAITKAITHQQPEAQVQVDVTRKMVTVETTASVAAIQKAIEDAGHTVEAAT